MSRQCMLKLTRLEMTDVRDTYVLCGATKKTMAVDLWLDQSAGIDYCSNVSRMIVFLCYSATGSSPAPPSRSASSFVESKLNLFDNIQKCTKMINRMWRKNCFDIMTSVHCVALCLSVIGPWGRISTTLELWVDFVMLKASTFHLKEGCVIIHISNLTKFCFKWSVLFTLFFNWHVNCSNSLSLKKAEQLVCLLTLTQEETW